MSKSKLRFNAKKYMHLVLGGALRKNKKETIERYNMFIGELKKAYGIKGCMIAIGNGKYAIVTPVLIKKKWHFNIKVIISGAFMCYDDITVTNIGAAFNVITTHEIYNYTPWTAQYQEQQLQTATALFSSKEAYNNAVRLLIKIHNFLNEYKAPLLEFKNSEGYVVTLAPNRKGHYGAWPAVSAVISHPNTPLTKIAKTLGTAAEAVVFLCRAGCVDLDNYTAPDNEGPLVPPGPPSGENAIYTLITGKALGPYHPLSFGNMLWAPKRVRSVSVVKEATVAAKYTLPEDLP